MILIIVRDAEFMDDMASSSRRTLLEMEIPKVSRQLLGFGFAEELGRTYVNPVWGHRIWWVYQVVRV